MATVLEGSNLMLFVGTGSTKNPVAYSTSCKFSLGMKPRETSSKDDGIWESSDVGKLNWSMSTDALVSYDTTGYNVEKLTDLAIARTKVFCCWATVSNPGTLPQTPASTKTYTGYGFITSVDVSGGNGDTATFSINIQGVGSITKV